MAMKYGSDGSLTGTDALVRGIGYFSLALGVAELVAPGKIAKTFGLEGREGLLRAFGAREIAAGIGTLSVKPQSALWARVVGDVLDMGTLAFGARGDKHDAKQHANPDAKRNALIGVAAIAGIAALDAFAATLVAKKGGDRPPPADYSDRSGLPKGVEASRGYYRQKKERGPAVAHHDARDDRAHSGEAAGVSAGSPSAAAEPVLTETDAGGPPIAAGVALS